MYTMHAYIGNTWASWQQYEEQGTTSGSGLYQAFLIYLAPQLLLSSCNCMWGNSWQSLWWRTIYALKMILHTEGSTI